MSLRHKLSPLPPYGWTDEQWDVYGMLEGVLRAIEEATETYDKLSSTSGVLMHSHEEALQRVYAVLRQAREEEPAWECLKDQGEPLQKLRANLRYHREARK